MSHTKDGLKATTCKTVQSSANGAGHCGVMQQQAQQQPVTTKLEPQQQKQQQQQAQALPTVLPSAVPSTYSTMRTLFGAAPSHSI